MGEFGAVYVVSGRISGLNDTMPLRVEKLFQEYDMPAAFALASVLTFLALITLGVKTYLEKNFESFPPLGWEELVKHGLKALKASAQETELSEHNVSVGVVGKDVKFRLLGADELRGYLSEINDAMEIA
jgi:hypothetical protein